MLWYYFHALIILEPAGISRNWWDLLEEPCLLQSYIVNLHTRNKKTAASDNKAKNCNSGSIVWWKLLGCVYLCPCKGAPTIVQDSCCWQLHSFTHLGSMDVTQENFWGWGQIIPKLTNNISQNLKSNPHYHADELVYHRWQKWSWTWKNSYNFIFSR